MEHAEHRSQPDGALQGLGHVPIAAAEGGLSLVSLDAAAYGLAHGHQPRRGTLLPLRAQLAGGGRGPRHVRALPPAHVLARDLVRFWLAEEWKWAG